MEEISKQDLKENVVMIRINKAYHDGMSESELYDATRGIWRRKMLLLYQMWVGRCLNPHLRYGPDC